jgi:nucleoside-diphosphate-sugar epimerase
MTVAEKPAILITGAAGVVGTALAKPLAQRYDLTGLDLRRTRKVPTVRADIADPGAIEPLFERKQIVIHLAAAANPSATWEEVTRNNVISTNNVLAAACRAGVSRVIFASSNRVTGIYEQDSPYAAIVSGAYEGIDSATIPCITVRQPVRPDSPYAVTKVFGEAVGRYYSDACGLSVICLRIGTVLPKNRPSRPRHYATLLTHRDLVQLVDCSINAHEDVRFAIFYGVSANTWRFWDISDARDRIGYEPLDDAEAWR